jgi:hypothetical protein
MKQHQFMISYGVSDRMFRIPDDRSKGWKGWLEDRRPAKW